MHQTSPVSSRMSESSWKKTYKLQIMKFVPYVPSMMPPFLLRPCCPMKTQARIRQTNRPVPIRKSRMKWNDVPVRPPARHPHFFSLASRSAANAEEKNNGTSPMAGFTCLRAMPEMRRMTKAGGKVARDMARRAWGVDFWKTVKLIMVLMRWFVWCKRSTG